MILKRDAGWAAHRLLLAVLLKEFQVNFVGLSRPKPELELFQHTNELLSINKLNRRHAVSDSFLPRLRGKRASGNYDALSKTLTETLETCAETSLTI